ncbi:MULTISPECIES: DoxX family protein [unclassified Polaribacter]|uniref:DoxX family protein n=1 Tax=unclassified Polaribacter TaxID=196858 RepID=UPI0011BF04C7|nr:MULTISPECIES: DoxX family protein [unclassified Polaribacter]TXD50735.1 DoxX family protein [Polaribacter sp. IC063]TXD57400.1 DoxX family protein [Polaribacter sp. IC066]
MDIIDYIIIILKVIVGISILNVWLLQSKKATKWRGGDAQNIFEEFEYYGLSKSFCYVVGFLKVSLALMLLISIKFEELTLVASAGLAALLLGSIIMHLKVKDELYKSFPAFLFVIMNVAIAYFTI